MITRQEAIKILALHGFEPWEDTGYFPLTGKMEEGTNFDSMMGKRKRYNLRAVMAWLGY